MSKVDFDDLSFMPGYKIGKRKYPPQLVLTVIDGDGEECSMDIANIVRDVNGWQRITYSRYNRLYKKLKKKEKFRCYYDDYGEWYIDIPKIVRVKK